MSVIYKGRVFSVEVDTRRFPDGREHEVAVARHPPSVVLIPIEDDGRVVLIKQYRASVDRELWELPAGSVEPGESADRAARRLVSHTRLLRRGVDLLRVSGLGAPAPDSAHTPDEDEDIHPTTVTIDEARRMVARAEIVDLKTAFGLTLGARPSHAETGSYRRAIARVSSRSLVFLPAKPAY